jgi:hypothetical protein
LISIPDERRTRSVGRTTRYQLFLVLRTFAIAGHDHVSESDDVFILVLCARGAEGNLQDDHFEQAYLSLLLKAE